MKDALTVELHHETEPTGKSWASRLVVAVAGVLAIVLAAGLAATGASLRVARPPTAGVEASTQSEIPFPRAFVNLAAGHSYPGYDNDIFEDCVAATVGDFIITDFARTPSTSDIVDAFFYAGGTSTEGLSWPQLVHYWSSWPIDGTRLQSWSSLQGNNVESQVKGWLRRGGTVGAHKAEHAVIDMVDLPSHAVGDDRPPSPGNHMWLVVGYNQTGALVVSWGSEFEVSWRHLLEWSANRDGWGGFDVVAVSGAA